MTDLIKPGTDNKPPGKYKEVGPRGGNVSNPRIVNIDSGDRLPPTQEKGNKWQRMWIYFDKSHYCNNGFYNLICLTN